MDKGFKIYILLLLWLVIIVGVPYWVLYSEAVGLCGIIAASIGMAAFAFASGTKRGGFKKDMPLTFAHFCIFLAYSVVALFMIGVVGVEYPEDLALGMFFYLGYPIIVIVVESYLSSKRDVAYLKTIKVGSIYEEEESREGVPYYQNKPEIEFVRRSLWIVAEIQHQNKIILRDFHYPQRVKSVTIDDIRLYKKNPDLWYRTPEAYEWMIELIKRRATEEKYMEP